MLDLLNRRLLFVGGKGGVGKTTIAAALASLGAARGKPCLLVSTDPAHSLGDIFGRLIGSRETSLAANLVGLEIDPEIETHRYIDTVKRNMRRLVRPELYKEVDRQMELARDAPGAAEAALLERVAELMAEGLDRYDLVVFDTAPTGHTLRLLSLPEVMAAWSEGMLAHQERSRHFGRILAKLGARKPKGDELSSIDHEPESRSGDSASQIRALLLERRRKFHRARRLLLDGALSAFLWVVIPERLPILESRKALRMLRRFDIPVAAMVVNRLLPKDAEGKFFNRRREQEAEYLREIDHTFAAIPRHRVPLLERDVHDFASVRQISELLAGEHRRPSGLP
ncbi:MAG: ArsA family ATPase [Gammaproteobacteria bacterium]